MLRNGISKQPTMQAPDEVFDERVLCNGCGRKFNQKAAEKHIPNCMNRNKKK